MFELKKDMMETLCHKVLIWSFVLLGVSFLSIPVGLALGYPWAYVSRFSGLLAGLSIFFMGTSQGIPPLYSVYLDRNYYSIELFQPTLQTGTGFSFLFLSLGKGFDSAILWDIGVGAIILLIVAVVIRGVFFNFSR